MSFAHTEWILAAVPLLAGLLALYAWSHGRVRAVLGRFVARRLAPELTASASRARYWWKRGLVAVSVFLILAALARPQYGYQWQEARSRGVDVIVGLDVSRSMLAEDIRPSRFERAKLAVEAFAGRLSGERVGLLAFAGEAFMQCPLTLDRDGFELTLEETRVGDIPVPGTNLKAALREAEAAFPGGGTERVLVLISDGEDRGGAGLAEARRLAREGVRIYTVGVGTEEGAPIPVKRGADTELLRDKTGKLVTSRLEADSLRALAGAGGGFYVPLDPAGAGLRDIYERGVRPLQGEGEASRLRRIPNEQYRWPLAAAIALLALEPLIGTRRRERVRRKRAVGEGSGTKSLKRAAAGAAGALALGVGLLMPAPGRAAANAPGEDAGLPGLREEAQVAGTTEGLDPELKERAAGPWEGMEPEAIAREARRLYQDGEYALAAQAFAAALERAGGADASLRHQLGTAYYRDGAFARAARAFEQALPGAELERQQEIFYNAGNARFMQAEQAISETAEEIFEEVGYEPARPASVEAIAEPAAALKRVEEAIGEHEMAAGLFEEAEGDFVSAVELKPADADASANRRLAAKRLEQTRAGLEALEELRERLKQEQERREREQQGQEQEQGEQEESGQQGGEGGQEPEQNQEQPREQDSQSGEPGEGTGGEGQDGPKQEQSPNQRPGEAGQSGEDGQRQEQPGGEHAQQEGREEGGQQEATGDGESLEDAIERERQRQQQESEPDRPGGWDTGERGDEEAGTQQPDAAGAGEQPGDDDRQADAEGTRDAAGRQAGEARTGQTGEGAEPPPGGPVYGVMSAEEAAALLDALRNDRRKLPMAGFSREGGEAREETREQTW